ncbi:transcriptional repressor AgaR [Thalassotalea maritima]|uniref:transcriptional repressor AgaR n=1 Tax=Thalassotalea maritima TaxID=3242416 RepID=UPI0035280C8D
MMLSTIERRQAIVDKVNESGKVDVPSLADEFSVSTVTIRTDLNDLHKKRMLVRSRGGAVAINKVARELSIKEKHTENQAIKEKLGKAVSALIKDGDSIIIDSGTTTQEVAKAIFKHENLVVMTNGLNIASELSKIDNIKVLMTGGTLRNKSLSFYGRQAEHSLDNLRFDKVILGVDGIELSAGISTHFEYEAALNRIMCERSKQIIAVTDSSKFNQAGFHIITPLESVDILVTDSNIPREYVEYFSQNHKKLILVDA